MLPQYVRISRVGCGQGFISLAIWLLLGGVVAAQAQAPVTAGSEPSLPSAIAMPLRVLFPPVPGGVKADDSVQPASRRDAQAEMAELGLELTKAKVAGAVKSSHLELERLQQLSELTRRLASGIELQQASYDEPGADLAAARKAKVEAEMFQADRDYCQALANLKTLIGER